jgi:uncharacterized membrane protein AbrB (regulator of aidB expression)
LLSERRGERSKARGPFPVACLVLTALLSLRAVLLAEAATLPAPAVLCVVWVGTTVSHLDSATDITRWSLASTGSLIVKWRGARALKRTHLRVPLGS